MSITRKRNRAGKLIKKPVLNTQQIVSAPLELKNLAEPAMKKMQSEVKTLNYVKKERKEDNIVNDLKNELIYKRDLEIKQKFPKGKFIIAFEPSERQQFYVMRLKECLNPKKAVAWVDFYDLTNSNAEFNEYTIKEEGLVQWDNMIAVLNIKVKPKEEVSVIKLFTSSGIIEKIYKMMGVSPEKKRALKSKHKREVIEEEKGAESSDAYDPSECSETESINLLPSEDEDFEEEKIDTNVKGKKKRMKRVKKTPAMKAAAEEKKRKDAENLERRIHVEVVDSGVRITKTRIANDGVSTETVELDPTLKEVRPRKWKFVEREEEDKLMDIIEEEIMRFSTSPELLYLDNSIITANRNIIRAALTDNVELAKACIAEVNLVSSLMEPWSPELKSTAIELAISHNSRGVLELLLEVCKEEEAQNRTNLGHKMLISKFDTGEVSNRAFGTKVRKVEMMRGARQGNNAFMQDIKRNEEYKTIFEQLMSDEILSVRAAYSCNVEISTLRVIFETLGKDSLPFFKQIYYHILRTSRRHLASECLEILRRIGDEETKSAITDEMIQILQLEDPRDHGINLDNLSKDHTYDGVTYLHLACMNKNAMPLVKELIDRGFSLGSKDKLGATPIFYAAVNPEPEVLKYILEDDSQYLRVYDKKNNTPLIMAIIAKRSENIHYILQLVPSAIKDKSILRLTPLSVASRNGFVDTVRTVMSYKGSAPNQAGGWEKMTPLCYAAAYGYYDLVEFLLTFTKAKIDKGDKFGRTPLMLACRNGHVKIASLLLRYGASVKTEDTSGNSSLHYAAAYGFPECVGLLLDHNADVNSQNLWKSTPLAIAMLKRNLMCVNQLLEKADNVNANIKDDNGNTLLGIAVESMTEGNFKMLEKLLKDADPNIPDADGNTPLIKVIQRIIEKRKDKKNKKAKLNFKLEIEVAKRLLDKGADPGIKNKAGQSAITLVMQTDGYSNTMSKKDSLSELIELLWQGFSFVNSPESFFSFTKNILSPDSQSMILTFIEKSIKELKRSIVAKEADQEMLDDEEEIIGADKESTQLPSRVINTLDDDGYTPFLRFIAEFTVQGRSIYEKIERHITSNNITKEEDLEKIDLAKVIKGNAVAGFNQNNMFGNNPFGNNPFGNNPFGGFNQNAGVFGQNYGNNEQKKLALKCFDDNIAKPFTEFLKDLVNFGADQHATVDKLKYYRDEVDQNGLKIRKRDSHGKIMNEYCDKGLSNALHLILEFPALTVFDFLLDSGVSTEEINIKKMTPFFMLIKTKDTNLPEYKHCLDKFINSKSDIDSPDQFGISAFWYCYQNNKVDLALYLATKGADINRLDNYGFFALKSEVFNNNLDRIRRLIDVGANVNTKDEFQRTVLHHAFNRYRVGNDLGIIRYLISKGADINAKDFKQRTPLHYLFVKSNRRFSHEQNDPVDVIVECLNLYQNIVLSEGDNNGNTVLHYICQRQAIECLKLLKQRIKVKELEITNKDGNTPIAVAMLYLHQNVVTYLINNFEIDLNGFVHKRKVDNSHVGNNVQGEESDFEFMLTEEVKEDKATELERLKYRKSYFEYCIMKPELNIVAKLLLEKGYSISKAFKDAFKAGNYQQLFQLLKSMDAQNVKDAVKIKDELGRNIFHALSKAPENTAFVDICNTLMNDYNLDPNETDDEGTTPIMLAAKEGKLDLVKALECVGCSIKDTNNKQENCIHLLMKGTRIKKYNRSLLKYLISKGVDFNSTYEEPEYASPKDEVAYKCTPLIHLIRTEHLEVWDKGDLLDDIFEQRSLRIDPNQTDSDGKDIFMHLAILNDYELCKYIIKCVSSNYAKTSDIKANGLANGHLENGFAKSNLRAVKAQTIQDQVHKERKPAQEEEEETIVTSKFELFQQDLKDKKELEKQVVQTNGNHIESPMVDQPVAEYKYGINLCRVDELGRSVVHYILTPVSYGSFENDKFLEFMLKFGFKGDIVDKEGFKPVDYALRQSTGTMLEVFKDFKLAPADLEIDANICSYRKIEDWENVNYMKDAQDFLDLVKMNVDKEKLVPCDPAGKFNDDCIVYEDPEKGYYDCHLTRVDIGREERDDYLFYKLQIVYDKGRDLWMLFTRWGRIGEEGAFQKTPYSKEECIQQFETIFFNKTKNEWKDRANFKKHWWKYQLINVNYSNMCHKDYLVPFDLTNAKPSNLHPSVQEIMREMTQVAMYVKGLQNSGIDAEQMPFSDINRSDLLKARESLTKLREILEELEPMEAQLNRFNKDGKDKIVALREKMWYHSSRFYELIPHEQYKNEIVPPINKMSVLKEKAEMIDNLINFEMASKILLGAHKAQKLGVQNDEAQRLNSKATEDMNPLDYCVKAMGVEINALDKTSSEFNILKEYCVRTWPENKHAAKKIRNIFKIQRKGEGEAYEQFDDLSNKFLLFHGSRISNFMGIMSQGLRVAPPEAPKTGYMFGKGVYFADMFQKSINYCNDFNASPDGSKYVLLCEVAVGKSYKLTHAQYMDEPPEGCDSTQGLGRSGPCYAKCFTFPEGYKIPKGKYLDYEYDDNIQRNVYLRHNEFIIYKSNNKNQNKVNHKALPSDSNPGQIKMRYLIQVK